MPSFSFLRRMDQTQPFLLRVYACS